MLDFSKFESQERFAANTIRITS